MRGPSGQELSALLDPPIEGPGGGQGTAHDVKVPFMGSATIRNGDLVADILHGVISFFRVEQNGSRTLLISEYTDTKALQARYYRQDFRAASFEAQFSFTSTPDEQFYGVGQQACCKDHSVNKKGQVIDFINFNSNVRLPVYMSNKVGQLSHGLNYLTKNCPVGIPPLFQHAQPGTNRYAAFFTKIASP